MPKPQGKQESQKLSAEVLIRRNGDLVESLISHEGWGILEELIDEGVASVSGRKTNGFYYEGDLTRSSKNRDYLAGYQQALTELYNRLKSFVRERDRMITANKQAEAEKSSPLYNPMLEDFNGED